MMEPHPERIEEKIRKLGGRIKNTSTVRFAASKRVRFDYKLANFTVVILSLWSILNSFILIEQSYLYLKLNKTSLEIFGLFLPVFIVVFSLIEGGENLVRAHLMELNARQLRELGDEYFSEIAKISQLSDAQSKYIEIFKNYSKRYNDTLERSPINHDDIDHWGRHFARKRKDSVEFSLHWWYYFLIVSLVWMRRQTKRIVYITLWLSPFLFLFIR